MHHGMNACISALNTDTHGCICLAAAVHLTGDFSHWFVASERLLNGCVTINCYINAQQTYMPHDMILLIIFREIRADTSSVVHVSALFQ